MADITETLRQAVKRWRETNGEGTRRALDVLAVAFAVVVFARGFEAHAGFAVAMAVFLGVYFRVVSSVVVSEYGVDIGVVNGPTR
jgi:anti-sigma factor RsiW